MAELAGDRQMAAMAAYDVLDDREAEAGPARLARLRAGSTR